MVGSRSGQLLSYQGKVLIHGDRAEMQWLFPNTRIVRVTDGDLGQEWMHLRDHPELGHFRWPLRREDFTSG